MSSDGNPLNIIRPHLRQHHLKLFFLPGLLTRILPELTITTTFPYCSDKMQMILPWLALSVTVLLPLVSAHGQIKGVLANGVYNYGPNVSFCLIQVLPLKSVPRNQRPKILDLLLWNLWLGFIDILIYISGVDASRVGETTERN